MRTGTACGDDDLRQTLAKLTARFQETTLAKMKYFTIPFLFSISNAQSCRCFIVPSNDAFCGADWVAHVKVLNKSAPLMINSYEYVTYNLQEVKLFKISAEARHLSSPVMTTSNSSSCGVSLVEDEEYLLTGMYYDRNFLTSNCGQVIDDEQEGIFDRGPMKWKNVNAEFLANLGSFKC
uniref:NTR domain-containing protein n=1 Tax=Angiostrongylus cantonensis TaxID=6313 RepID=A0A0K0DBQ3_ANGCA